MRTIHKTLISLALVGMIAASEAVVANDTSFTQEPKKRIKYVAYKEDDFRIRAENITMWCEGDYDKVKTLYEWICTNIAFDTTYTIDDPGFCFDNRRGVCQAYCELFYQLSRAIGIESYIVKGTSRNDRGDIGMGHAWIAVKIDGRTILMDPTWGAGTVVSNSSNKLVFKRNEDIWTWFDVQPEVMIFTHCPDEKYADMQGLDNPLTLKEFKALPSGAFAWSMYGMDIAEIYRRARYEGATMPKVMVTPKDYKLQIVDIPYTKELRVASTYTFRVKLNDEKVLVAITDGSAFTKLEKWHDEGDGVYSIDYTVRWTPNDDSSSSRKLSLVVRDANGGNNWKKVAEYNIAKPTIEEQNVIREAYPRDMVKGVEHLLWTEWKAAGVDEKELVRLITEHDVKSLAIISNSMGGCLTIDNIPMHYKLKVGCAYTFSFYPKGRGEDKTWAIIEDSGQIQHDEWSVGDDGKMTMTIQPTCEGRFCVSVDVHDSGTFSSVLVYQVIK